jgi:hypothetical protein
MVFLAKYVSLTCGPMFSVVFPLHPHISTSFHAEGLAVHWLAFFLCIWERMVSDIGRKNGNADAVGLSVGR